MNKDLDLKALKRQLLNLLKLEKRHAAFIGIMFVLLVYLLTVWRIGQLAGAEPSIEQQTAADNTGKVLRVDKAAIKQIQELEHNSTDIQSLFNEARKNPFRE